jgi:pyruvate-formate lyase-activating enzyme
MSEGSHEKFKSIMPIIDKISPTLCLAKWHHASIYLHTGNTHSCYHPAPHNISLEEIKNNPSALHNTLHKKKERAEMLLGTQPKGCKYCWNIENMGPDYVSDRHIKTSNIFTEERFKQVIENKWDQNINPEYIEIAFSNECNFKCGYCHPMSSSSFQSEIKKYGPYDMVKNHRLDIDWFNPYVEDKNPYVDAWWRWWPELSKTLNILRITGGEPLMHKTTWKLFEHLRKEPKQHLELNINSNLGVKPAMVNRLAENVVDLVSNKKIKRFKLFTSLDTWGARAEYLRTGLDIELWEKNFHTFVKTTRSEISVMCTFNVLSVTSFISFLEKILEWRKMYKGIITNSEDSSSRRTIRFDTPYLKEPLQYDMHILPKDAFLPYFDKILQFIDDNRDDADITKFSDIEYEKFRRVRDYFANIEYSEEIVNQGRKDFYLWFKEYDRRRGTDFLKTFPEMEQFYNQCKELSDV